MCTRWLCSITFPTPFPALCLQFPFLITFTRIQSLSPIFRNGARIDKHALRVREQNEWDNDVGVDELIFRQGTRLETHEQPLGRIAKEENESVNGGNSEVGELHGLM
jgi:hypothetical protein